MQSIAIRAAGITSIWPKSPNVVWSVRARQPLQATSLRQDVGLRDVRAGWDGCGGALVRVAPFNTPIWPLFYSQPTPALAHLLFRNVIMPAHRHSTTRSHASGRHYKASIIVISSDEEGEPVPVAKRGSRRPRRSRGEGGVLEILDDTSVKVEEPELEDLRRRCHELEQACCPHCCMNPPSKRDLPPSQLLRSATHCGKTTDTSRLL
jgi:hypothetical protein